MASKSNSRYAVILYNQCVKKADPPVTKRLYSIKEAAIYLGRSENAVREIIWAGKIPFVKDGRRILLDIRDMDEWIEANKTRFTY